MVLGMKKPVETPLPRQLVESLWVLRLRAGENLLYNDASAVMQAAYVADTGRYLEAKLAQLSAAILQ